MGKSYSKQTTQPKQRKTLKHTIIHHKVSPTKVKPQKTTKAIKPGNKKPHWLSTATKTKRHHQLQKLLNNIEAHFLNCNKKKSTKPSVKTSIKTTTKSKAKPTSTVKVKSKSTYSQPKRITTINHLNVGHPMYQVGITCVISVKRQKNQALMML